MKISVIGLGFVGLTTALGFASKGLVVYGYENIPAKREKIENGMVPFFEPGLQDVLRSVIGKSFFVKESMAECVSDADVVMFCVGTPCNEEGAANLTYLTAAVAEASQYAPDDCFFVVKSTVPPGTVDNRIAPLVGKRPVAMNPEFLREGHAWDDFIDPDRIVIGTNSEAAGRILTICYESFGVPVHLTSPATAEFIKYLSNSLLATLISFSNEMADLADRIGKINISDAFHILCEDKRLKGAGIGHYIYPGCGYGGSCLPKDTKALKNAAHSFGKELEILGAVIATNEAMPTVTAEKIIAKTKTKEDSIGILGLSFKPGSDDVRDTPAARIIGELVARGYRNIYAYDPIANENFARAFDFPSIVYCDCVDAVCKHCAVVAVVTSWEEFLTLKEEYPKTAFVDCRYCLEER